MPNAVADRIATRYGTEVTWGTVPASAARNIEILSDSLQAQYDTEESEAVTGDRQVPAIVRVGQGSSGGLDFEFTAENLDNLLVGALCGAWAVDPSGPDILENGDSLISYSLEKHFQDITQFATYTGLRVDTFGLNFAPKARLTGSLGFMGKAPAWSTTTAFTGSPVAATASPLVVTSAGLTVEVAGVAFPVATEFSLETTNELRMQDALGAVDPIGIGIGVFRASGSISAYFPDRNLVDRIVADTYASLAVEVVDSAGSTYRFVMPSVKLTTEQGTGTGGRSQDVIQQFGWTARRDPVTGKTLRVERTLV